MGGYVFAQHGARSSLFFVGPDHYIEQLILTQAGYFLEMSRVARQGTTDFESPCRICLQCLEFLAFHFDTV
ncbi:MAG: hypothetical protein U0Q18_33660 [Bryobacteraceae bacterium]